MRRIAEQSQSKIGDLQERVKELEASNTILEASLQRAKIHQSRTEDDYHELIEQLSRIPRWIQILCGVETPLDI
jgi:predicted nuclease with TOPRIM domain